MFSSIPCVDEDTPGVESDVLSPEEIAVVLKMQEERRSYIPESPVKWDGEEEMKMVIALYVILTFFFL